MGRSRSRQKRSRSRRKTRERSPESQAESDVTGKNGDGEDLEARVALLEVENATLKAENQALRKKLVEALRRAKGKEPASASDRKEADKNGKKSRTDEKKDDRRDRKKEASPRRMRAKSKSPKKEEEVKAKGKKRDASMPREEDDGELPEWAQAGDEDDNKLNAVLLLNPLIEAYNEPIPNNTPLEKRLPMVEAKMGRFLEHFGDNIQIMDLKSGGVIIKDRKTFKMRYACVFRESGAGLKITTNKRFYFDASGKKATYCLDFEHHESLVTPTPGTRPDGSLGCRPPREEHLAVLYEEQVGKICRMWIAQDQDKVGKDAYAGEEVLVKLPVFKQFEKKIAELRGTDTAGEYFFNNYHNIPTVG